MGSRLLALKYIEPNGLLRSDGRPDGMTIEDGQPSVWDATNVETLVPSYLPCTLKPGAAASAESLRWRKYKGLSNTCLFKPIGVETGAWGPSALQLYSKSLEAGWRYG